MTSLRITNVDHETKTITFKPWPEWKRYWPVVVTLFGVRLCNRLEIHWGMLRPGWGLTWNVGKTPKYGGRFYYSWVLSLGRVWIAWDAHAVEKILAERRRHDSQPG